MSINQKITLNLNQDFQQCITFRDYPISKVFATTLLSQHLVSMTKTQELVIPAVYAGQDINCIANQGAGKTIAYLLPLIDLIFRARVHSRNGTLVLIIVATKQEAIHVYKTAKTLAGEHITIGFAVEGASMKKEADKLGLGSNIVIATPDNVELYEELGLINQLSKIFKLLPNADFRQLMLFGRSDKSQFLSEKGFVQKTPPQVVNITENFKVELIQKVPVHFIEIRAENRLNLLYTLLMRRRGNKLFVLTGTDEQAGFLGQLFLHLKYANSFGIHEDEDADLNYNSLLAFKTAANGVFFVSHERSKQLNVKEFTIDSLIFYDAPKGVEQVALVSAGDLIDAKQVLLFLMPNECKFGAFLQGAGLFVEKLEFDEDTELLNQTTELRKLTAGTYEIFLAAQAAFQKTCAYLAAHPLSLFFNVTFDPFKYGTSYCLDNLPCTPCLEVGHFAEKNYLNGTK